MKNVERVLVVALFIFSLFCLFIIKANAKAVEHGPMKTSFDDISNFEYRKNLNSGKIFEYYWFK